MNCGEHTGVRCHVGRSTGVEEPVGGAQRSGGDGQALQGLVERRGQRTGGVGLLRRQVDLRLLRLNAGMGTEDALRLLRKLADGPGLNHTGPGVDP